MKLLVENHVGPFGVLTLQADEQARLIVSAVDSMRHPRLRVLSGTHLGVSVEDRRFAIQRDISGMLRDAADFWPED